MKLFCSIKHTIVTTILMSFIFLIPVVFTQADSCESISDLDDRAECYAKQIEEKKTQYESTSKKLEDIRNQKNSVSGKITTLASQLNVTQAEIDDVQEEINKINDALNEINSNLKDRKGTVQEKLDLRNIVIRNYAKSYRVKDIEMFSTILINTTTSNSSTSGFSIDGLSYGFAKYIANDLSSIIYSLNTEIESFEKDKKEAESLKNEMVTEQNALLAVKRDLDSKKNSAQGEFNNLDSKEDDYQGDIEELEEEISELSSKQQAILQAKGGESSASLSEGVETDDSRTSPNYNPGFSPAFGVFSYGAYTHRNGMSQYGAKGRAEDGQDYEEILEFYYDSDITTVNDLDDKNVKVDGFGTYSMKEYLYGLGEMPSSWPKDALRAQAVAARTYANRYLKTHSSICANTNCQYFHSNLINGSGRDAWREAVDDTENEILEKDVSAQYSSTTGGWVNGVGWDTDGGSWPNDSYERKAGSPWFYKAWFTQTYVKSSSTCGRSHPWLNGEEMADILNAYVLLKAGKNTERVIPETINDCPLNGVSGDPYDKDELRNKADDIDKGFEEVTNVVSVNFDMSKGKTSTIVFSTDQGNYSVDAQLFMEAFNVRAPGYIAIKYTPDSKGLFDILKK